MSAGQENPMPNPSLQSITALHSLSLENLDVWNFEIINKNQSSRRNSLRKSGCHFGHPKTSTPTNDAKQGPSTFFGPINFSPIHDISAKLGAETGWMNSSRKTFREYHVPEERFTGTAPPAPNVSRVLPRSSGMLNQGSRNPLVAPGSPNLGPRWRLFKRNTCPNLLKTQSTDNLFRLVRVYVRLQHYCNAGSDECGAWLSARKI